MAIVYRAVLDGPSGFERPVAIKRIRPDLARDHGFRVMLLDEARLSGRLQHPNVVQVLECGEVDGELYIAMELLEGFDLRALITRTKELSRSIPAPLVAFFGGQLAAALHYAHSLRDDHGVLNLVHRDVSPTNVMLTTQGAVKLLDFGIAKATGMLRDEETRTGVVKGKFSYMSPEQAGGHEVDSRSDLFALGIVLIELLTFKQPFRGENDLATLRLVREAKVPPVSSLVPGLSPEWDAVMLRLLAAEPSERFQTGQQVEQALLPLAGSTGQATARDFLQSLGLGARVDAIERPTSSVAVAAQSGPTLEVAIEVLPVARPARRGRVYASALAVAALVMITWVATRPAATVAPVVDEKRPAVAEVNPPPPPPPAVVPAPVAPVASVVLEVHGPKGAKISIDGQAAGSLPFAKEVASRKATRRVRVEKVGFVPFEREVPGDSSVILETLLVAPKRASAKASVKPQSDVPDPFR